MEETETRPTVTALFATDFPTGHFRHFNPGRLGTDEIGGGAFAFTTGLNVSKYVKPFIFYGNLWYTMQTAFSGREDRSPLVSVLDDNGVPTGELGEGDPRSTSFRNYPRDIITVNLAAEYPITQKWVALLELTSSWEGGRLFGHTSQHGPGGFSVGVARHRIHGHGKILPGRGIEYRPDRQKHRHRADANVIHGICLLKTLQGGPAQVTVAACGNRRFGSRKTGN